MKPAAQPLTPRRVNVLGVGVSVLNLRTAVETLTEAVGQRRKGYVCVSNVHVLVEAQYNPAYKRVLNRAFLVTPDGMPLVWAGRLAGYREMGRVYGPELMLAVFEATRTTGQTHFLYGGMPGVAEDLKNRLEARFPGVRIVGTGCPPFRPLSAKEETELEAQVRAARPDFFWTSISTPKQDLFNAALLPRLDTALMIGVGAAFDFHTGRVAQAPRWIQRSGFEWLYRLCREPRRLWKRYLTVNPVFLALVLCQITGLKKFTLDDNPHV
ncbi:MAG: WecB/TagA/CpsF family glycosyltransferase [Verrucomicrobia bacterium]|jgi:N-acetylglucosaminyldiphosphoundecaprenol N-acetyl-beta-D-mannosaminyltransferase|nr:WecB/TagA/CpsF family glycosyltransferase [Verrucomicrobiota bacterium]OQC62733.1 MAG: putative N-acetylmannosaminyltransferase [Verrucomicrobia bacterium ADurb.Bin006]MDI9380435.1 WecB/TagA/CpsF family glycosyltransferase [Verrucomicrobiota bacterium]NMD21564.1 WecB/TagA/CpsF family glycosyltransferase [Verrucomicrobiota bacterium]HNU99576.1 WecB/TagA/CpsF family glycosyltransferase [Verrucomicrobiota bacterium]